MLCFMFVFVSSSSKNQLQAVPMKIAIAGADSYIGSVLRPYVELLSSKSPEWLNFLRFLIIPFSKQTYCLIPVISTAVSSMLL